MNNKKKIVTVIIPVYNCEKYLVDCFDSVLNQSIGLEAIDIIIVNDGSTDGSAKIINKYKKRYPDITVINQKNSGLSAARNAGLEIVKTDYITFFDSDDILPETALEDLIKAAASNNADIVIGGMENFTSAGYKPNYTTKYLRDYSRISYKKNIHLLEFVHACGKLYRTKFVIKKRFMVGAKHEDNYYTLSLYLSTDNISMIKKTVYCRRDREGGDKSITQTLSYSSFDDLIKNYKKVIEENGVPVSVNCVITRKLINYSLMHVGNLDRRKAKKDMGVFFAFMDNKTVPACSAYMKIYRSIYYLLARMVALFKNGLARRKK